MSRVNEEFKSDLAAIREHLIEFVRKHGAHDLIAEIEDIPGTEDSVKESLYRYFNDPCEECELREQALCGKRW